MAKLRADRWPNISALETTLTKADTSLQPGASLDVMTQSATRQCVTSGEKASLTTALQPGASTDQLTESATRVFVTPEQRAAIGTSGGTVTADAVTESATRVFVTPEQKAQIGVVPTVTADAVTETASRAFLAPTHKSAILNALADGLTVQQDLNAAQVSTANIFHPPQTFESKATFKKGAVLGDGAPPLAFLTLTGTAPAVEGGTLTLAHALDPASLRGLFAVIETVGGQVYANGDTGTAGSQFNVGFVEGAARVTLNATNSENLLGGAVTVTLLYEVL